MNFKIEHPMHSRTRHICAPGSSRHAPAQSDDAVNTAAFARSVSGSVCSFEDHQLWYPDCNTNNIYITCQQDLIISYCKNKFTDQGAEAHLLLWAGTRLLCFVSHECSQR